MMLNSNKIRINETEIFIKVLNMIQRNVTWCVNKKRRLKQPYAVTICLSGLSKITRRMKMI